MQGECVYLIIMIVLSVMKLSLPVLLLTASDDARENSSEHNNGHQSFTGFQPVIVDVVVVLFADH